MKWNNVKPDILATDINSIDSNLSFIDITRLISETTYCPYIIFPEALRQRVLGHLRTKKVELGGLLVGRVISIDDLQDGIVLVEITDSVESRDFDSTSVSLSMNPDVWQEANMLCTVKKFVVGWYHSHPNLGAYFSSVDRKTQKDFFNSVYNLGLVIDPIRNEEKWFIGHDSIEVQSNRILRSLDGLALV